MKGENILKTSAAILLLFWMAGQSLAQKAIGMESTATAASSYFWRTAIVDSSGDRGTHNAIAFHPTSGTPWISYYDGKNHDLVVAHRVSSGGNCGPDNEWYCEVVDPDLDAGKFSSIDVYLNPSIINSQKVGVAYWHPADGALRFSEYSCSLIPPFNCSWSIETVTYAGTASRMDTSIKYDSYGNPHIAFYDDYPDGQDSLRYAKRTSGSWSFETVESGEGMGQYASLDLDAAAHVYIAYYDGTSGDLRVALRTGDGLGNCGSGHNWTCLMVDGNSTDVGQSVSFRWDSALHFAYYDATNGKLRYAVSAGGTGNCGHANSFLCYTIESASVSDGFRSISLATDGADHPLIAYRYASGYVSQLRVAQPVSDLSQANCGVPDGGFFQSWRCFPVDGESLLLSGVADHVSAAFDRNNLPMIAYSSWSVNPINSSSDTDLKIAYGRLGTFLPLILK